MMAFGTCLWNLQFDHGFGMSLDFMDSYYTSLISFLTLSMISFIDSCGFNLMKWCKLFHLCFFLKNRRFILKKEQLSDKNFLLNSFIFHHSVCLINCLIFAA